MLKKIIVVFVLMALLPSVVFAQNSKKVRCNREDCVIEILEKLKSTDKNVVAEAKRTLDSLAKDAKFTGDSDSKNALKKSIISFAEKFNNKENREFMFSLLPIFCSKEDAYEIFELVDNESIADYAIRTVGDIPGSEGYIEKYIIKNQNNLRYKAALAYAVGKLGMSNMENELISWIKGADDKTKVEIYNALWVIKTNDETAKIVKKGANKLYNSKVSEIKIAGMKLVVAVDGEKAMPKLYKALISDDRNVRVEALNLMKPFVNQKVCATVVKKCKKGDALIDAINWLGDIKNDSQMEFLIKQLSSEDKKVVAATICAIFKIDNPDGVNAVKPMFGGEYQRVIKESMIAYEGNYRAVLNDVVRGDDKQKLAVLQIVESRPDVGMFNRVRELLYSENQEIRDAAYNDLKYVVVISHYQSLSALLENCDGKYVEQVQIAIKNAVKNAPDAIKDEFASTLKHVKPNIMPRFYNVFAYFGTELCVDKLIDAYKNGDYKFEAKEALMLVENEQFAEKIREALK
ncbi:MAG: hypothetical protein IKS65_01215 [Bacteroidales bacterium]|nr:hypothetical protein [Bacteroidales bacterium]